MNELAPKESGGEFLLYQTEGGRSRIEIRLQGETAWRTQQQMADLFFWVILMWISSISSESATCSGLCGLKCKRSKSTES
ncbi:MAG: hypothetical protein U9N58_08980 [Thermodesulfobacteriota bacterium]|nr:hypothetical protein [Thermodesulfobacteriota bacterium]